MHHQDYNSADISFCDQSFYVAELAYYQWADFRIVTTYPHAHYNFVHS